MSEMEKVFIIFSKFRSICFDLCTYIAFERVTNMIVLNPRRCKK